MAHAPAIKHNFVNPSNLETEFYIDVIICLLYQSQQCLSVCELDPESLLNMFQDLPIRTCTSFQSCSGTTLIWYRHLLLDIVPNSSLHSNLGVHKSINGTCNSNHSQKALFTLFAVKFELQRAENTNEVISAPANTDRRRNLRLCNIYGQTRHLTSVPQDLLPTEKMLHSGYFISWHC